MKSLGAQNVPEVFISLHAYGGVYNPEIFTLIRSPQVLGDCMLRTAQTFIYLVFVNPHLGTNIFSRLKSRHDDILCDRNTPIDQIFKY